MSDMLSSDVLEQQFGPTQIEVLLQKGSSRIITTRVQSTGQILELSAVDFLSTGVKKFPKIHAKIQAGKSMGKAFRDQGLAFVRQELNVSLMELPDNFARLFGNAEPAHVVSVRILVGSDKTPYANILETYSPSVIWPSSKRKSNRKPTTKIHSLDKFLEK